MRFSTTHTSTKSGHSRFLYERGNHLGNVLTVLTDRKIAVVNSSAPTVVDHFTGEILTASDYYSFGSPINGRAVNAGTIYAYGFNGKRNDLETGTQDYGMRIYNPSLGKFLSVDPLQKQFAWNSAYAYAENDVIRSIDLDGLEKYVVIYKHDDDGSITKITIVAFRDRSTGKLIDQGLSDTNPHIVNKNADVLVIHERANGVVDFESIVGGSLTPNQNTIFTKYKAPLVKPNPDAEKRLDVSEYGLNNGKLLGEGKKGVWYNRSVINLNQEVDAKFIPGSDKLKKGEAAKFDPIIKLLKDFPAATVEFTGNTATDGIATGEIYGSSNAALNQPADLNGTRSNVGRVMESRAEAADRYVTKTGEIDPSRTTTTTGANTSNGNAGRTVGVKVKGID